MGLEPRAAGSQGWALDETIPAKAAGSDRRAVRRLLDSFEPITLAQMDNAALMERSELKYALPFRLLAPILAELQSSYRLLVVNGQPLSRYRTLYFDTPGLELYRRAHAGAMNRYKVRAREYVESQVAFLEVKHKTGACHTVKSRIPTDVFVTNFDGQAAEFLAEACPYGADDQPQPPGGTPQPPANMDRQPGGAPRAGGGGPPGGGGGQGGPGGGGDMTPENPMWVPATITFNGETWTNVGVRYKGNSTLTRAWRSGADKIPLKFDFDQFEDEHPEIKNQWFFGFKQLSLANNLNDASAMKDVLAYDIIDSVGLVAPRTAYYEVLLDTGDGPVSLGLYTMVEVVDDTVVDRSFDDDGGNIYEAEGAAASFAEGTRDRIEDSFQKENNEKEADWSDIEALYDTLHSDQRMSDPSAWRAGLEAVFDTDAFLEWLAINSTIQDWDAYGSMSHNYYLYYDPLTKALVWISWDHNEAFSAGGRGRGTTALDQANVGDNWPLIRFLLDDPIYHARYVEYLRDGLHDAFRADELVERIDALAGLVRPYDEKAGDGQAFEQAVAQLKTFVTERQSAVEVYLAGQE